MYCLILETKLCYKFSFHKPFHEQKTAKLEKDGTTTRQLVVT